MYDCCFPGNTRSRYWRDRAAPGTRLLRDDYIVPRPKLQRMDRKCICGRGIAAALNALLAEYYPFQLSVSVFRFSFPFQLSVSSVSTCPLVCMVLHPSCSDMSSLGLRPREDMQLHSGYNNHYAHTRSPCYNYYMLQTATWSSISGIRPFLCSNYSM